MADAIDTSPSGKLFNVRTANASKSPRDAHEPAPSENDSVPDLEPAAQPPRPAYEDTPVEPDPYLMLSYEVRQVWRLSAELRAALAHIKLLADIILRQAPAPGCSPYVYRRRREIALRSPPLATPRARLLLEDTTFLFDLCPRTV
ncbi:hypothetical protein EXIGLDRAFT_780798 [Exidia glandulosa HHB12029]|uniref:Uncharacterized protein n=1 Tax=Exidia glandulosa HHB12029 TaxID=1314781 RepID=A0A165BG71_EXIGL|nr:hypothetical protein EXIGLDRAFT_780798 [Exidia glandulosa HHB12029]